MKSHGWRPGWDGHLLLLYDDEAERRAGVAAWVRRGLELGAKVLYTEPRDEPPERSLAGVLRAEPGALEAMERGQVQVVPADLAAYDPAFMDSLVDGALSAGYPSVRWSGEASTAWSVMPRRHHELIEQATDELCAARPLSVMCQYAAREPGDAFGFLSQAHAAGLREQRFQAAPVESGLAVAGELDTTNHEILHSLLATATAEADGEPFVLDLDRVDFLDLPAARALLFGTQDYRSRGGWVRLEARQPHIAHLIRLLGVDQAEGIQMGETR